MVSLQGGAAGSLPAAPYNQWVHAYLQEKKCPQAPIFECQELNSCCMLER